MPTSIVLVDDHPVVRSGFKRLLSVEPDLAVIAEFDQAEPALAWLAEHSADVLIADVSMPGIGGIEMLRQLRGRDQRTKVIMLSMHDSPGIIRQSLEAGANGFLSKTSDPDELILGIAMVMHGGIAMNDEARRVLEQQQPNSAPHDQLSPKEFAVLLKLAEGLTPKQIADGFEISEKTAYNYQTKIYRKLNLSNGVQLKDYVQTHGLAR